MVLLLCKTLHLHKITKWALQLMAGDGSDNVGKNVGVFVGAARVFILVKYDQVNRDQVFLNRESVARSALIFDYCVSLFDP